MHKIYVEVGYPVLTEPPRFAHHQFYDASDVDARIAELEQALRFYSDARQWAGKDHYSSPSQDFPAWTDRSAAEKDRGDIARKALGL